MIAERSPVVKQAVVRLIELSADERARALFEAREKERRDNRARERTAVQQRNVEIAKNMIADGEPIEKSCGIPICPART